MPGFTGKDCQININDCEDQPCLHNGDCDDGINAFTCLCKPGYSGQLCEVNIDECKGEYKARSAFDDYALLKIPVFHSPTARYTFGIVHLLVG